jgi:hypothetical protein
MNWLHKVIGYKLLGACPFGDSVYHAAQRTVTRSLEVTAPRVAQKCQVGLDYLERLRTDVPAFRDSSWAHIDIGGGWMPTIPLLLYAHGIQRQLLCDVRWNMRIQTVAEVVTVFNRIIRTEPFGTVVRRAPPEVLPGQTLEGYFATLGIEYRAPFSIADMHRVGGPRLVTCTQVLQYLRPDSARQLFRDVAGAIRCGGIFAATIHLYDLYADTDPTLNPYNKYRYSEAVWEKLINGRFLSFNRLTAPDYRRLLEDSGLKPVRFEVTPARPEDLAALRKVPLDRRFRSIPEEQLGTRHLLMIAQSAQ